LKLRTVWVEFRPALGHSIVKRNKLRAKKVIARLKVVWDRK
jgi:hypothetical protein